MSHTVRRPPWGRDDGAATVLVLAAVCLVMLCAGALLGLVQAQSARSTAQAAADLGALAAAEHRRLADALGGVVAVDAAGPAGTAGGSVCERARAVVERNDARLTTCAELGAGVVEVGVEVTSAVGTARATSWAGPDPGSP